MGKLTLSNRLRPTSGETGAVQFALEHRQSKFFQRVPLNTGSRLFPTVTALGAAVDLMQLQRVGVHVQVRGVTFRAVKGC